MIITFTSDFGLRDPAVAATKAALMRHVPDAAFVDVCHTIAGNDLQHAAYLLQSVWQHFPAGTVHIVGAALVTGGQMNIVLVERMNSYAIVADNGILPLAFPGEQLQIGLCATLSGDANRKQWAEQVARVIGELGKAQYTPYELRHAPRVLQPRPSHDGIECNILFIDRYENVVLNITRDQFEEIASSRPFRIRINRLPDITTLSRNYNDVGEGQPLCRFNEAGYLEIALNRDRAASWLGLSNQAVNIRYQTVRIFF